MTNDQLPKTTQHLNQSLSICPFIMQAMKRLLFIYLLTFCSTTVWSQGFHQKIEFYVPDEVEKKVTGSIKMHTEVNGNAYKVGEIFEFEEKALFSIYYSDLQLLGAKSENIEVSVEYGNYDYFNEHFNPVNKDRIILEKGNGNIYPYKFTVENSAQGSIGIKLKAKNTKTGEESYLLNSKSDSPVLFEVEYNLKKTKATAKPIEQIAEDTGNNPKLENTIPVKEPVTTAKAEKETIDTQTFINTKSGDTFQGKAENQVIDEAMLDEEAKKENTKPSKETEAELWAKIQKSNSTKACVQYLRQFGKKGKHYKEVSVKIDKLWWNEAQKEAKKFSNKEKKIKAYVNYLSQTKYGAFRDAAKEQIDDWVWAMANEKGEPADYLARIPELEKKHGDFPNKHTQEISLDYEFSRNPDNESEFSIELKNVKLPIKVVDYDKNHLVIEKPQGKTIKGVFGSDKGVFDLVLEDKSGREIIIPLDNKAEVLTGSAELDKENNEFVFTEIIGGYPPYFAELRQNNNAVTSQVFIPEATGIIKLSSFEKDLEGMYDLILLDANKRETFNLGSFDLNIVANPTAKKRSMMVPLIGLGLFLLGALFVLMRQMSSNKRDNAINQKVNERNERYEKQSAISPSLKIKKKDLRVAKDYKEIYKGSDFLRKNNYRRLDLSQVWESSKVSNVLLAGEAIQEIDDFVKKEKRESMENETDVPEIGGFLLGQTHQNGKGIDVAVDKFVPISTGKQSVYTVEFGASAWVELAEIQEDNPEMELIGWFHTHPGHGLFLSRPDLKIQNGFFTKEHQIAIEIDPLTKDMDTALFSWKKEGNMNNKEDKSDHLNWFKWTDILK